MCSLQLRLVGSFRSQTSKLISGKRSAASAVPHCQGLVEGSDLVEYQCLWNITYDVATHLSGTPYVPVLHAPAHRQ